MRADLSQRVRFDCVAINKLAIVITIAVHAMFLLFDSRGGTHICSVCYIVLNLELCTVFQNCIVNAIDHNDLWKTIYTDNQIRQGCSIASRYGVSTIIFHVSRKFGS